MSTLLEKLRRLREQPADGDVLEYFGIKPGEPFQWDRDRLVVGNETVTMDQVREAMGPAPDPAQSRRIVIADLGPPMIPKTVDATHH